MVEEVNLASICEVAKGKPYHSLLRASITLALLSIGGGLGLLDFEGKEEVSLWVDAGLLVRVRDFRGCKLVLV